MNQRRWKAPHDNNNDEQNVGAHSQALDSYVQGLLNQIVHGQIQAQNGLATTGQPQFNTNSSAVSSSPLTLDQTVSNTPQNMSWKDPKIYLSSAANGKSASVHYDIVDFVEGGMQEEIIVGGAGSL